MAAKCQGLVKLSFQLFLLGLQLGDVVVLPEAKKAPSGLERRDFLVRNDDMPPPQTKAEDWVPDWKRKGKIWWNKIPCLLRGKGKATHTHTIGRHYRACP